MSWVGHAKHTHAYLHKLLLMAAPLSNYFLYCWFCHMLGRENTVLLVCHRALFTLPYHNCIIFEHCYCALMNTLSKSGIFEVTSGFVHFSADYALWTPLPNPALPKESLRRLPLLEHLFSSGCRGTPH